jgi:hypothetical protein
MDQVKHPCCLFIGLKADENPEKRLGIEAQPPDCSTLWFGGGACYAGGLGMSVGAGILSGGVLIVGTAIALSVTFTFHLLDVAEQERLLKGRIEVMSNRISRGMQPEWQTV